MHSPEVNPRPESNPRVTPEPSPPPAAPQDSIQGGLPPAAGTGVIDKNHPDFARTVIELLRQAWPNKLSEENSRLLDRLQSELSEVVRAGIGEHPLVAKAYREAAGQYRKEGGFRGTFYGPSIMLGCRTTFSAEQREGGFYPVVVNLGKFPLKELSSDRLPREVLGVPVCYQSCSAITVGRFLLFFREYYRDAEGKVARRTYPPPRKQ